MVNEILFYLIWCYLTTSFQVSSDDGDDSAVPVIAAVAAVGGVLIIAVIVLLVCMLYKSQVAPKAKTHDLHEILQNEKSFTSIGIRQKPPQSTSLTGYKRTGVECWEI